MNALCRKLLFFSLFPSFIVAQGFVHRDGQNILDANGKNLVFRGLGLGGWMVQEGYMIKTGEFAGPQFKIREKIVDVIGEQNTVEFYKNYKNNGISKADIDSLAAWGFNSVRLPMHYNLYTLPIEKEPVKGKNTWLEEGFKMTDELLEWCTENKIYLILDLHAAPGGQGKDANISDYDETKPSLWESEENQEKMIAFWKKIAERYKDNPWIGAYDIINEPNWNFSATNKNGCDEKLNAPLRELQVKVTQAIREVDKNHLIFIEGNCWGNNYSGIFPLWDDNTALSFHKYWNYNDVASINQFLEYRKQYNVPIWLGESGENSNAWFTDAIRLMETNNIGWAFWPMKKIDNIAGVTSVLQPKGYDKLLHYWEKGTNKPSKEEAKAILFQVTENYKMSRVEVKRDVIDAMFRQVNSTDTKPFKKHKFPGKVFATEFDLGQINQAYFDKDAYNYWVSSNERTQWNKGNKMRNDAVDIEECNDRVTNGYQVSHIEDGEWLQYTVEFENIKSVEVEIRYLAGKTSGEIYLSDATGNVISSSVIIEGNNQTSVWKNASFGKIKLNEGQNKIRMHFAKGGDFKVNYIEFKK